ncbi:MAG TPA: putative toxin-antitoxin system toxin component, PIN family [Thermomicrobiales bacterium]|nr:putative toxin-antitoxin system toxin component, PIN family [Thermomicrobiales bacterium]
MPRVVVDPGVLVSAVITPNGLCGQILRQAISGSIALLASPAVLEELADVLSRPKFRRYLSLEEVDTFVALVARVADIHPDPPGAQAYSNDPDDDYLIAHALSLHADHLISGDTHLQAMTNVEVSVMTPRAFLERYRGADE